MKQAKTPYAILGFLKTLGPMSGYQIKKAMTNSTDFFWSESYGALYPAIKQLEGDGLIIRTDQTGTGNRTTIVYQITDHGTKALSNWLSQAPDKVKPKQELLLKLFFLTGEPDVAIDLLGRYKCEVEETLAVFNSIHHQLSRDESEDPSLPYWLITLNHGITHAKASLKWCSESIKALNNVS